MTKKQRTSGKAAERGPWRNLVTLAGDGKTSVLQQGAVIQIDGELLEVVAVKNADPDQSMSDKPHPWPTHGDATNARNRTAEELLVIVKELTAAQELTNDPIVLHVIARALKSANLALRHMESQGAPTRPE